MKLTQRTTATGVTLNDTFIHVVNTGDTSQDPTGSSYKAPLSLLSPLFTGGTGVSPNLQKEIVATHVVTDADNGYVIFINNGATAIGISMGAVTIPNFSVGFIQEGTADVTFSGVSNPTGLKIKGQGYQTFIERKLSTATYYLLGNTKA